MQQQEQLSLEGIYLDAIQLIKGNHLRQGIAQLNAILDSPLASHNHRLLFSALLSLGEVHRQVDKHKALEYFEAALVLAQQLPSQREKQFEILIAMMAEAEKLGLQQRQADLLQKALQCSPEKWRKNLQAKLAEVQARLEVDQQAIEVKEAQEKYEEESVQIIEDDMTSSESVEKKEEEGGDSLERVRVRINLAQPEGELRRYSLWQKIVTISYILLKCTRPRNLNKKPSLAKPTSSEDWRAFLNAFHPTRTRLELVFYEEDQQSKEHSSSREEKYGAMIKAMAEIMLQERYRGIKGEMRKYWQRDRFQSLSHCLVERMRVHGVRRDFLNYLQHLNGEEFSSILGGVQEGQFKQKKGVDFEKIKDKHCPFPNSWEETEPDQHSIMSYNRRLNNQLKEYLRLQISVLDNEDVTTYNHSLHLAQQILYAYTQQSLNSTLPLTHNYNLTAAIGKLIVQSLHYSQSPFELCYREEGQGQGELIARKGLLVELAIHKAEMLSSKMPKDEAFAKHQLQKIQSLCQFIKSVIEEREQFPQQPSMLYQKYQVELQYQKLKFSCLLGEDSTRVNALMKKVIQLSLSPVMTWSKGEVSKSSITSLLEERVGWFRRRCFNQQLREQQVNRYSQSVKECLEKSVEYGEATRYLKIMGNKQERESLSAEKYFSYVAILFEKFFKKLEGGQVQGVVLQGWGEVLQLRGAVAEVYSRFMKDEHSKEGLLDTRSCVRLLFSLIKLYLLRVGLDSDVCLRIIFFSTSIVLSRLDHPSKDYIVPRILALFSNLIRYQALPPKVLATVRKKLYSNIISKNLKAILSSPVFTKMDEESRLVRQHIVCTFREIYTSTNFQVKKIDDSIGLLVFLSRSKEHQMQDGLVEFQPQFCPLLRQAHQVFQLKRGEIVKYCAAFGSAIRAFQSIQGEEMDAKYEAIFMRILRGQSRICECCCSLPHTNPLFVECLLVLAKFLEYRPYQHTPDEPGWKESPYKFHMLQEQYFLEHLLLDASKKSAWLNLIRASMAKVLVYYDSLVGECVEELEGKVGETRKLIRVGERVLGEGVELDYWSELLDLLKIREREYRMVGKDLEGAGMSTTRESKESIKNYKSGLKSMLSRMGENYKADVRVRYMRVVELKLKLAWVNIEKEYKEDDKKDVAIVELEDYQTPYEKVFKPTKLREQITEILNDIKGIIHALPSDPREEVLGLEEDLIMEAYVFLYRNMEWKLEKIINRLCEVIRVSSKTDQCRKLKEMQFTFNELDYTANMFMQGDFITSAHPYRIRGDRIVVNRTELNIYEIMFQNTFAPRKEVEKTTPKGSLFAMLADKYGQPKGMTHTIELDDDSRSAKSASQDASESHFSFKPLRTFEENQGEWEFAKSRAEQRIRTHFNPEAHIDVGKYFYGKLKQYMIENESAASRFNSIHSVVGSFSFHSILQRLTKIMQELFRVFNNLIHSPTAHANNRRVLHLVKLTASQLVLRYSGNWQKANELIKDMYSLQSDEIVFLHPEMHPSVRIPILSDYYCRSIVVQLAKCKFIEHLFMMFSRSGAKENLVFLLNKLLALSQGKVDVHAPKDARVGVKVGVSLKGSEQGEQKKRVQIRFYYYLFELGTTYFVDLLKRQSRDKQLSLYLQKQLLKLRDEVRARMGKDDNNFYYNRIEDFRNYYEDKYSKSLRGKKPKEEKKKEKEVKKQKKERRRRSKKKEEGVIKLQERERGRRGKGGKKGKKARVSSSSSSSDSDMKMQEQID